MPENDGWGHALESTTVADDLKELTGFLEGIDKHEQVMHQFEERFNREFDSKEPIPAKNSTNQSNNQ